MAHRYAVVLSGCGHQDGSEIHEATMTLLAISRSGATYQCFAPDVSQKVVVNHISGEPVDEKRNALLEASRIARGEIKPLTEYKAEDFDALVFPGGYGAATTLSNFAEKGAEAKLEPSVESALKSTNKAGKPIGALCIAPNLLALAFDGVELTIGDNEAVADNLKKLGAVHKKANHGEVVVDRAKKIATTPCYMLDADISQIADGAENLIGALQSLLDES